MTAASCGHCTSGAYERARFVLNACRSERVKCVLVSSGSASCMRATDMPDRHSDSYTGAEATTPGLIRHITERMQGRKCGEHPESGPT